LKSKIILASYVVALLALFFISIKIVMPLVGQELMPAMDTGGVKIKISLNPNLAIEDSKKIVTQVESILKNNGTIESISASIGSEAGVLSIGSGGGIGEVLIIANYVNRFEREKDIWSIEENLKKQIAKIPHIKTFEVSEAGATAMASIKANIDVTLYGDDFFALHEKANEYLKAMQNTKGIVSATKSWHIDTKTYSLDIDNAKALFYGITDEQIISYLQPLLRGAIVSKLDVQNATSIPIRVMLEQNQIISSKELETILIPSKMGMIPLKSIASISIKHEPNIITRDGLSYTIDILGFRQKEALSLVMANFDEASKEIVLPPNMKMKHTGDIEQFSDSSSRIVKSVAIGLVLILLVMIPMFESLKIPIVIILSIPLTIAGASWILLLLDYHSSMSAMIGFILLAGVIVNNAILLVHFALERQTNGLSPTDAMIESIKVRTRPVLMTAFSVSVGMIPVALGWAIGMERLAPLGAVVIGGLIVGTFLTLLFIPIVYIKSIKR
jgi:multidrug efflux pump subunit AcrB